mmetsp:Transcript_13197/g.25177  ORF Transcript_13197/g.25177 Transcript_13197/m.25177 type:complete len:240 (+) Transcript_13197:1-720(+)
MGMGLMMDYASLKLTRRMKGRRFNFFFLNTKSNWSVHHWLAEEPEILRELIALDRDLRLWLESQGIHPPFNHFLLKQTRDSVSMFFHSFVGGHPRLLQFLCSPRMDLRTRREFLRFVLGYQSFLAERRRNRRRKKLLRQRFARLLNVVVEPYFLAYLLQTNDDVHSLCRAVWRSYARYTGNLQFSISMRVQGRMISMMMNENANSMKNYLSDSSEDEGSSDKDIRERSFDQQSQEIVAC